MKYLPLAGLACTLSFSPLVLAERITVPVGQQHQNLGAISKPGKGQSKAAVLQQFGEPVQRYAARGEPPISRWEYPGFIVYFEHQHVIHSVVKHRPVEQP